LKPDFNAIADFRSDNRAAFRAVFRQFRNFRLGLSALTEYRRGRPGAEMSMQ
jgi:hypothetical protein